jgi:predicted ATPase
MRRFILTGTPGSGKTAIIRQLELDGFSVVEEAATDVIALGQARGVADPWKHPSFIDSITELQRQRQLRAPRQTHELQIHDRSAICTAALAAYLGYPFSDALSRELKRIETDAIYQKRVFFIRNLGYIKPTEARRISFEEAQRRRLAAWKWFVMLIPTPQYTPGPRSIRPIEFREGLLVDILRKHQRIAIGILNQHLRLTEPIAPFRDKWRVGVRCGPWVGGPGRERTRVTAERSAARSAHQSGGLGVPSSKSEHKFRYDRNRIGHL